MGTARVSAALAALVLLAALGAVGCGGGGSSSSSSRERAAKGPTGATAPTHPLHAVADYDTDDYSVGSDADDDDSSPPYDHDGDSDNETGGFYDSDDAFEIGFGHAADAPDARQARSLIRRYFAAASSLNGREGCALMLASIARHIPEIFGKGLGPPYARGNDCPQIVANVFAFYRRQLLVEAGALEVASVRVRGPRALAVLTFKRDRGYPARLIELAREGDRWRMNGMLDNELP